MPRDHAVKLLLCLLETETELMLGILGFRVLYQSLSSVYSSVPNSTIVHLFTCKFFVFVYMLTVQRLFFFFLLIAVQVSVCTQNGRRSLLLCTFWCIYTTLFFNVHFLTTLSCYSLKLDILESKKFSKVKEITLAMFSYSSVTHSNFRVVF